MKSQTPNTMCAAAFDQFGGGEKIKMQVLPVPEIGHGQVLVRVVSAGVGRWDVFEREGMFAAMYPGEPSFPYVLGSEGAGTVVAVGDNVVGVQEGDQVYGLITARSPKGGFYSEYAAVDAEQVWAIPRELTTKQAGAMPIDAGTALRGLRDSLELKNDEALMIFGASGGIGHLAVQLAKRMGARVLAVASGNDGVALAERLGAEAVVEGHTGDVAAAAREFTPTASTLRSSPPAVKPRTGHLRLYVTAGASPIHTASSPNRKHVLACRYMPTAPTTIRS